MTYKWLHLDNAPTDGNGTAKPASQSLPKPVQPSTPSAAVLATTFSTEQLPELSPEEGHQVLTTEAKPKVEVAKVEEVKPEALAKPEGELEVKTDEPKLPKFLKPPKTEEKVEKTKTDEVKSEVGIVKVPDKSKEQFDYTGFTAGEKGYLENMSKVSREYAGKLIKENRKLAESKDSSYLQHPNAYTLHPEFIEAQQNTSFLIKEGQYWQEQLELCKLGKPVKGLTGFDNSGNPVTGPEMAASDKLEEQIRIAMQNSFGSAQKMQAGLRQFGSEHQNRIKTDLTAVQAERAKRFPWVADPKILDYSISIHGHGDRTIKQIREDIINLFPPYHRNSPGVEVAADMMVGLIFKDAEIAELKGNKAVVDIKKEEADLVEPSQAAKPMELGVKFGKVRDFSLAGAGVDL